MSKEIQTRRYLLFLKVTSITKQRNDTSTEINRLGAGDIIGEMSLLTGEKRQATITALTTTKTVAMAKDDIAPLLQESPELVTTLSELI